MEKKEKKLLTDEQAQWLYPLSELAGGIYKSYFSTYIALLMTSVYVFPVTLAGALEVLKSIIGWIASPLMGTFLDNWKSKKFKYWAWFIIFGGGCGIFYILIFSLPVFSANPSSLAIPAAILIILASLFTAGQGNLGVIYYTRAAKNEKMRNKMAMWSKITRDGMKVLIGFLYPLMLVSFQKTHSDSVSWALIAVILAGAAFIIFVITGLLVKRSPLEAEAMAGVTQSSSRKKPGLGATMKGIFTNPYLLVCFISLVSSKIFFFHISGAAYFWSYYMNDFVSLSKFMTVFSLAAIIGALLVPAAMKIFKDTKRTYVASMVMQAVFYAISIGVVSETNTVGTIAVLSGASFFNGISDSLILSLFAGATDYAMWKTGTESVGLTMSTYSISVTAGVLLSTILRTSLLANAGFDSAALKAGAEVPVAVRAALRNMNTIIPLVLSIGISLLVAFGYRLNDKKLAQYREEIKARKAANK